MKANLNKSSRIVNCGEPVCHRRDIYCIVLSINEKKKQKKPNKIKHFPASCMYDDIRFWCIKEFWEDRGGSEPSDRDIWRFKKERDKGGCWGGGVGGGDEWDFVKLKMKEMNWGNRDQRWFCGGVGKLQEGFSVSQSTSQALFIPLRGINTCSPDTLCHLVVPLKPVMMMTHKRFKCVCVCVHIILYGCTLGHEMDMQFVMQT